MRYTNWCTNYLVPYVTDKKEVKNASKQILKRKCRNWTKQKKYTWNSFKNLQWILFFVNFWKCNNINKILNGHKKCVTDFFSNQHFNRIQTYALWDRINKYFLGQKHFPNHLAFFKRILCLFLLLISWGF